MSSRAARAAMFNQRLSELEASADSVDAKIEEAAQLVAEEHRDAFRDFITQFDRGHLDPDSAFLEYWERDENCQRAVRQALEPVLAMVDEMKKIISELVA